jgi:RES domain-containing protein
LGYRAHNPRWALAPTSGDGAARHGGRFNPRGTAALYTSLDPKTGWMEAPQGLPFKAQPMTLVGYRVRCERIIDLTDPAVLAACGVDDATLACAGRT